eukprot:scaffold3380_cov118-Isochrysis_galbana.AAC.4
MGHSPWASAIAGEVRVGDVRRAERPWAPQYFATVLVHNILRCGGRACAPDSKSSRGQGAGWPERRRRTGSWMCQQGCPRC